MSNKFAKIKLKLNSSQDEICDVPCICPHCGAIMAPQHIVNGAASHAGILYMLAIFVPNCCEKPFYVVYTRPNGSNKSKYTTHYPNKTPVVLPESLSFSPRFVEYYAQSNTAEQNGHLELASCGYRNALEMLVKDFAVIKLGESAESVSKKTLVQAIESYLPQPNLKNGADIVRILGNT